MEIVFDKVNFKYSDKYALKNINISLSSKKVYGLIGKSGAGKTTFLQLIDGLIKPSSGNITELSKKDVGFVFQFPEEQFFNNNVLDEISFALKNFNMSIDKVNEVLKIIGLNEDILNKNPKKLSNGEKRMVAIASSIVYNPKVILLDEPTVGLDNNNRKKIINLIKLLRDKYNRMIIIVSHDIDLLYEVCDDFIVLSNGKIVLNDEKNKIYEDMSIIEKYDVPIPNIIKFETKALSKNKRLLHSTCINDLIKEIYRNV